MIGELYQTGMTIDRIISALTYAKEVHGISMFYADPSEPAYIRQCQEAGLLMVAANNEVLPGIDAVARAIVSGLTVDPSCQGLLGELPGYTWMPSRIGGFLEKPIEINDDACDALRYAVQGLAMNAWGSGMVASA